MTDREEQLIDLLTQTGRMEEAEEYAEIARKQEREKVLEEVNEAVTQRVLPAPLLGHYTEDKLHQRWQVELNQLKEKESV